jgi:hypothetical protein
MTIRNEIFIHDIIAQKMKMTEENDNVLKKNNEEEM